MNKSLGFEFRYLGQLNPSGSIAGLFNWIQHHIDIGVLSISHSALDVYEGHKWNLSHPEIVKLSRAILS